MAREPTLPILFFLALIDIPFLLLCLAIIACIGGPVVLVPLLAMPFLPAVDRTVPRYRLKPIRKARQIRHEEKFFLTPIKKVEWGP